MTEFVRGDQVRVAPDAVPYPGKVGKVTLVDPTIRHGVSVEMHFKGFVQYLAYAPDELRLVGAVLTPGRTLELEL